MDEIKADDRTIAIRLLTATGEMRFVPRRSTGDVWLVEEGGREACLKVGVSSMNEAFKIWGRSGWAVDHNSLVHTEVGPRVRLVEVPA